MTTQLGFTLPVGADPWTGLDDQLDRVAAAGFDSVWVRDVPLGDPSAHDIGCGHDPVALLSYVIGRRLPFMTYGAAVLSPTFRGPMMTARAADSLQSLSAGRFHCGLGAGARPEVLRAFGHDPASAKATFAKDARTVADLLGSPGSEAARQLDFYRAASQAPPISVATKDPAVIEALGPRVAGYMTLTLNGRALAEERAAVNDAAGRALACVLQVALRVDHHDASLPPSITAPGAFPQLQVGARVLPRLLDAWCRAEVDHLILALPADQPYQSLTTLGHAWTQVMLRENRSAA